MNISVLMNESLYFPSDFANPHVVQNLIAEGFILKRNCEILCYSTIPIIYQILPVLLLYLNFVLLTLDDSKEEVSRVKWLNFALMLFYAVAVYFKLFW